MSAVPNSYGIRGIVLVLAFCLCSRIEAQVLDLDGITLPDRAGLGDTLTVGLKVHTAGRELTSVGLSVQFDPAVLQPLDPSFDLDPLFFPQAVVYENSVGYQNAGTSAVARARLVAVAPTASGGPRQVMVGDGLLATADFVVVGFSDSAHVHIVTDGGDRPLYTELGYPGVEGGFHVLDAGRISVALDASGFLALPDVQAIAGRVQALGLRGRTASDPVSWRVRSPDRIHTWVQGDSLLLQAPPRSTGVSQVDYEAVDAAGAAVGSGSLRVTVIAPPALLHDPGLSLQEDFGTQRYGLETFLESAAPETALIWDVSAEEPLLARVEAGDLVLAAPQDWWGMGRVTLRLPSGRDMLDSLQIAVPVTAVNDAPNLQLPDLALSARVGTRSVGPALSDWISDIDDDASDLRIELGGDGVEAWQEDGRLHLRGLRAGSATVDVRVIDPSGASTAGSLRVEVAAASLSPVLTVPADLQMRPGQRLSLPLHDLVADADASSFRSLTTVASATGAVLVHVTADSLVLTATGPGEGAVRLSVTDEDANTAAAVWLVGVVETPDLDDDIHLDVPAGDTGPVELPEDLGTDLALEPFGFATMARLDIAAGTQELLDVSAHIEPAGSGQAYSVSGATFVDAEIDAVSGVLRVLAPPATAGREVLLLTAVGAQGQVTTVTLEVLVVDDVSVGALRLLQLPDIRLDSDTSVDVDLDAFTLGAQGVATWSVTTTSDLIGAVIEKRLLRLTAGSMGGQVALLLTATDEGGRRASELLHVYVSARAASAQTEDVRVEAPEAVALSPGDQQSLDLGALVVGAGPVQWSIADSAGLTFELSGDTLHVRAATAATAGWRDLSLQAMTASGPVSVRLSVAISALPPLSLRQVPSVTVVAGQTVPVLWLDSLVTIGDPQAIHWAVDGGVLLKTALSSDAQLTIDASQAVPGREVLQITASLDGDMRRQSVAVVVLAPQIAVAAPDTLDLIGNEAAVLLDSWVQGDLAATQLRWRVTTAPDGIAAHWDLGTRRLHLAGAGVGTVALQASLASGLQVGALGLVVRLREAHDDPTTEPSEAQPWTLLSPQLQALAAGDTLRVPLRDLVDVDVSQELVWQVQAEGGLARIEGAVLELSGQDDFQFALEAWRRQLPGHVQRLQLTVPVQVAAAPVVHLTWALEAAPAGASLRLVADVDADVTTDLVVFINGQQQLAERLDGAAIALPLPHQAARIQVVAAGRRQGATGRDTLELHGGWLTAAEQLQSRGSPFTVSTPAGLSGPVGLICQSTEQGLLLARTGTAAPLLLQATDTGEPWTTLQQQTPTGWQDIPGAWHNGEGMRAFTDAASAVVQYRAARVSQSSPQTVTDGSDQIGEAFPNPFNASVTLPVAAASTALQIYDATGRIVRTLPIHGAGSVHWNGRDSAGRQVASGVYYYRLQGPPPLHGQGTPSQTGKLTLLR